MTLSLLINRECQIVRRTESGEQNEYGDDIPGETVVDTTCELQQRQRAERGDQGEVSDTSWLLILPAGAEIDTGDAVIVDGEVYELVGDPWPARNPRVGQESHVEATVRRTAGEGGGS